MTQSNDISDKPDSAIEAAQIARSGQIEQAQIARKTALQVGIVGAIATVAVGIVSSFVTYRVAMNQERDEAKAKPTPTITETITSEESKPKSGGALPASSDASGTDDPWRRRGGATCKFVLTTETDSQTPPLPRDLDTQGCPETKEESERLDGDFGLLNSDLVGSPPGNGVEFSQSQHRLAGDLRKCGMHDDYEARNGISIGKMAAGINGSEDKVFHWSSCVLTTKGRHAQIRIVAVEKSQDTLRLETYVLVDEEQEKAR
ncbi:hypothetical protein ACFOWE_26410 [Planomonospora corallina]|uniref:Serine/threonine protein kinase n=1 Tax=Planomonospora corallina TaxID=1806052 RepID=A0ABV8ICJ6_9ACTN